MNTKSTPSGDSHHKMEPSIPSSKGNNTRNTRNTRTPSGHSHNQFESQGNNTRTPSGQGLTPGHSHNQFESQGNNTRNSRNSRNIRNLKLLEEYSPVEAKSAGEFRFIEWLFVIQQIAAIVLIAARLLKIVPVESVTPVLEVISQNTPTYVSIALLALHLFIVLLVFIHKRPITFLMTVAWLAGMAFYSIVEIVLGSTSIYNVIGIVLNVFWIIYFLVSTRLRLRFYYTELFERAVHTITCPHCKLQVLFERENCGDTLTEQDRFDALCERITDIHVPVHVRATQIGFLKERFGKKAQPFLKKLYEKQLSSEIASAQILSALVQAMREDSDKT